MRFLALGLLLACGVAAPAFAAGSGPAREECDRLAAHPLDRDRPSIVDGVEDIAPEDVPEAVTICEAAVKADPANRRLLFELGRAYEFDERDEEAMTAYRKAADGGSTMAMSAIALLYIGGRGVAEDVEEARSWFLKAAEAGDVMAMGDLGSIYGSGMLGEADFAEARRWFEKAAAAGYGEAMFQLGLMDQDGDGAPADDARAKSWFEKAAAAGVAGAWFSLGDFAENGRAGPKDLAAAIAFYKQGVDLGDRDAGDALERLRCPVVLKDESGTAAGSICFDD